MMTRSNPRTSGSALIQRLACAALILFAGCIGSESVLAAPPRTVVDGTFLLRSRHEILDAQLRAKLAADPGFALKHRLLGRVSEQFAVGQTKTWFQVYNFGTQQYESRLGTLAAEGTSCHVFIEDGASALLGSDPNTVVEQIRSQFDTRIFSTLTEWFGSIVPPAQFGLPDNKVYLFLCDIRDNMPGGYIAGYFDSRDLEGDLGNRKPIFFMDLNPGRPGNPADRYNDFYKTLAHEFQHMINFCKHLPQNGRQQEDRWVEEGLSGFAEYIYTAAIGDGNGLPPTPHLARFLESPEIVLTNNLESEWFGAATLFRHYGASFLFMYYLQEKFGGADEASRKAFLRSVVDNPATGINGLNSVLSTRGTNFVTVLKNWLVANHLNDPTLNGGMWGYLEKDRRLGSEAAGLPLPGTVHTHSPSGLSFVGGEGRIVSNAGGRYANIAGSGNFNLVFKAHSAALTPFLATVDYQGNGVLRDLLLDENRIATLSLDLAQYRRVVLIPAVATTQPDLGDAFYYSYAGKAAQVVVYPIPNPAFTNEFMIVLKSLNVGLAATPTVSVSFNNIQNSPVMMPADEGRTLFVANYAVPGPGNGNVTVNAGGENSSFSFFSAALRTNISSRLQIKDAEFSVSVRQDGENAFLFESPLAEVPSELNIISKPYYVVFNPQNAIEARLLFECQALGIERQSQLGLWSGRSAEKPWGKVSRNERGYICPISAEGPYVLVADTTVPGVHDLRIEEQETGPTLSARVEDGGSGILRESIRVEVNGQAVPFNFEAGRGLVTADLARLPKGSHRFSVELTDRAENVGRAVLNQVLVGPLTIIQATAYPNPSRGAANLAVILDGSGSDDPTLEIEARIYDVAGQKVISLPLSYKSNHTFTARWDQRNEDGKPVANGVYPFKVVVRKGGDELKANGKLAVLN